MAKQVRETMFQALQMIQSLVQSNGITAVILAVGIALTLVLRYGLERWTRL